jgi:hypothetical protein
VAYPGRPTGLARLIPAPEPPRYKGAAYIPSDVTAFDGGRYERGTARPEGVPSVVGLWRGRVDFWRQEFEREIAMQCRKYWRLWRNEDTFPSYGVGEEWRDRTTIPSPFRWIETRLPRKVMATYGAREWFSCEGRSARDEAYESMVVSLVSTAFDQVGSDAQPFRSFIQRAIDCERYTEIMGHAWWKGWWREEWRTLQTKRRTEAGGWKNVELQELVYSNTDWDWLPLDALAIDLNPYYRKWAVERVLTTYEALEAENEAYKASTGEDLYPGLSTLREVTPQPYIDREGYSEPEDTENWPLYEPGRPWCDPFERPVEMWLCWDNVRGTLTKIGCRKVVLDDGLAPTPRRLDPYIANPAVPIPNRAYGDSTLNWTGDLANRRTRLNRARMDEALLGVFPQFVRREDLVVGAIQRLLRPGGDIVVKAGLDPSRPLKADFDWLQHPPALPDATREDLAAEQEGQLTCSADTLNMGGEATSKSRNVAATEVQQRVLQGSGRMQMENLYKQLAVIRPMLNMTWGLLRQNLTQERLVRYLDPEGEDQQQMVTLLDLESDVDFKLGGGVYEVTKQQRLQEIQGWVALAASPVFAPVLEPRPILEALAQHGDYKGYKRFFKKQQQVNLEREEALTNEMAMQMVGKTGGGNGEMAGMAPPQVLPAAPMPFVPGAAAATGVSGEEPAATPSPTEGVYEEL